MSATPAFALPAARPPLRAASRGATSRRPRRASLAHPRRVVHCTQSSSPDASPPAPQAVDANSGSSAGVTSGFWEWAEYGRVHYRQAGTVGPVILFVPGFGVGAFHFEGNVRALSRTGFRVYAVDKLGLGRSAVSSGAVASAVSPALWRSQIIAFIEEVLQGEPVFLAGNSLGGLLCAAVASERSDLVRGAVLLNAAPFWTGLPPAAPPFVRSAASAVLQAFWRRLTNAAVVRQTLALVYAREEAVTEALVSHILAPTRARWAQDAFQAALLAPPLVPSFEHTVADAFAAKSVPMAAINGRSDPWVGPVWGARLKKLAPACALYELDPCGHCAHDEAAAAVEFLVSEWVRAVIDGRPAPTFGSAGAPAGIGDVEVVTRSEPLSVFERLAGAGNMAFTFLLATIDVVF